MKKYVGTKVIEAENMSRGDYNQYRGWEIPENEDPRDEGYIVKYSDGYESWSPKKQFEESYREYDESKLSSTSIGMQSTDYKDRFQVEYKQLKIRKSGLSKMLEKYKDGTLKFTPSCSYELLHTQLVYMECYSNTLEERAKVEGICLESED